MAKTIINCACFLSAGARHRRSLALANAARYGHLSCMQQALKFGGPHNLLAAFMVATRGQRDDCFVYVLDQMLLLRDHASEIAAILVTWGSVKRLEYAYTHGVHLSSATMCTATELGKVHHLKFLHSVGVTAAPCHRLLERAADAGALSCLKFLYGNGISWGPYPTSYDQPHHVFCEAQSSHIMCVLAMIHYGHLQCLEYAYNHGCPWPKLIGYIGYQSLECTRFIVDFTPALFLCHCMVLFDGCVGVPTHATRHSTLEVCSACAPWVNKHSNALMSTLSVLPHNLRGLLCVFICEW